MAYAAHGLGAFLSLAALTLLSDMVSRAQDRRLKDRLAVALMIGFTAASAWSPFYVSVAVVLAACPGMKWTDIAAPDLFLGFAVVGLTAAMDPLIARRPGSPPPVRRPAENPYWGRLIVLLASLMAAVITVETVFHLSIPVVLALVSPPFAVVWLLIGRGGPADARRQPRRVVQAQPGLRGEALVFVSAKLFGTRISAALDPAGVAGVLHIALWPDWLKSLALALFIIAAGAAGLHPVVLVIIIGTALPPDVFGMPPLIMALVMLGTWGLSTTSSPFSGTTLVVGRLTGESSFRLAWTSAPLYTVSGAVLVALIAWAVWRTGWFL
ncbi:MAG: hypothetical protein VW268_05950 [Rhodospirillaceae bacterium]